MLESWNDTPARRAITEFVEAVSDESSPRHVAPEDRIAVFDNDGTLWCEKPMQVQIGFLLQRLGEMASQDASLRDTQPWKAAHEHDVAWFSKVIDNHYAGDDSLLKVALGGVVQATAGMSVHEYIEHAGRFITGGAHPTLQRAYSTCTYLPMVELLRYVEAHGFTAFIASGGDRDFVRAVSQELYGIPPERVIGSSNALSWVEDEEGSGSIVYLAEPDVFDDGPVKPIRIWSRIGRRPILSVGNSNGDIPMLAWTDGLRVLVNHDDAEREFDYTAGADVLLERAASDGWTVVSVRDDWSTVFV